MLSHLRCEYKENPIGIDSTQPRLSWKINSTGKNIKQAAYHIQIAKNRNNFECKNCLVLDTGKIKSEEVFYTIETIDLESETEYFWRVGTVAIVNGVKKEFFWSETAGFITGLSQNGWKAKWIKSSSDEEVSIFRKDFSINKPIKKAILYGTALGIYELKLNNSIVADDRLAPGWTDYKKRIYYRAFDVTDTLLEGKNVLGGSVAPGWYAGFIGPLKERCFYGDKTYFSSILKIQYKDNTEVVIQTDNTWKAKADASTYADMIVGEEYDARLEAGNWTSPDYEVDANWKAVDILEDITILPKVIQNYPGVIPKPIAELKPENIYKFKNDYIIDFGQNISGVVRLKLNKLTAGQKISIKYIEAVNEDGSPYTENLRDARVTDIYTAKGAKEELWEPKFTIHGFRYLVVYGLTEKPFEDTFTGIAISSIYRQEGNFECGLPKVNRLFKNIYWGFVDNYLDIPTDCPQRDERLGWTGDTQVFIRTASYMANIAPFMRKWLVDMDDQQNENGAYHEIAPAIGSGRDGRAAWADAGIICPYELWKAYGDVEFIRPFWKSMKRFMSFIFSEGNSHNGEEPITYGDWLNFDETETPHRIIGLAYRAYDARLMAEMAEAIGEKEDAEYFKQNAKTSLAMFKKVFFDSDGSLICTTQTACALAIWMDLLDGSELKRTADCLIENVINNKGYLTTGFVGSRHICPALTKIGRHDLAVQLLLNEGIPSWLYAVNTGATTIWERWNGWEYKIKYGVNQEAKFGPDPLNSLNHYAYGAVGEWMFRDLAGIQLLEPGYKKVKIEPKPEKRLGFVKANYNSIYGNIISEWKYDGDIIEFNITIPAGIEAEICLPDGTSKNVGSGEYQYTI